MTLLRNLNAKDLLTIARFTEVREWGNLALAVDRSAPLVRATLLESPLPWKQVWHVRMGMKAKRKDPMVDVTAKIGAEMRKAQKKATKLVEVPETVLRSPLVRMVRRSWCDRQCEVQNPETKEWFVFADRWHRYIERRADGTRRSRVCRPHEVPADAFLIARYWRATAYDLNRAKLCIAKFQRIRTDEAYEEKKRKELAAIRRLEQSLERAQGAVGRNPDKWLELKERRKKTKKKTTK